MASPALPHSPAAERNRHAIHAVLQRLLPPAADVLEIASGTGQHAAHCAQAEPRWTWQPSDADPSALPAIARRCAALPNVRPALHLDVLASPWPTAPGAFDAVYCANMLHISPWATCAALMEGAAGCLRPGGLLLLYGPFFVEGEATAPSNLAFDADLRARDPAWGLRRLGDVSAAARAAGLDEADRVAMPAHNLTLAFRRR